MHPFYGPSGRFLADPESRGTGLMSMAAYLAFWAVAVGVGLRELNARFPKQAVPRSARDGAVALLRERYARGEVDREQFLVMSRDLASRDLAGRDLAGGTLAGPDAVRRERSRV